MSLVLGDNFSYQGAKPLDARLKYDALAQMKAMADSVLYDGCLAFCKEDSKTYQWISTNEVDATTGRWREFKSGSGGSSVTLEYDTVPTKDSTKLMKSGDLKTAFDKKQDTMTEMTAAEVDAICTISDEDPTDGVAHMLFPNTWTPGVEYNFGDGVYGQRFTGNMPTIAAGKSWSRIIDYSISNSSNAKIIDTGGYIEMFNSNDDRVITQANTVRRAADISNSMAPLAMGWSSIFIMGNNNIIMNAGSYSNDHSTTSNTYDVWVLYTKEA